MKKEKKSLKEMNETALEAKMMKKVTGGKVWVVVCSTLTVTPGGPHDDGKD